MGQILNEIFYNASDFEIKILQRFRVWKETFTTRQNFEKNTFFKSLILKKKIFLKSTLSKKELFLKSDFEKKL